MRVKVSTIFFVSLIAGLIGAASGAWGQLPGELGKDLFEFHRNTQDDAKVAPIRRGYQINENDVDDQNDELPASFGVKTAVEGEVNELVPGEFEARVTFKGPVAGVEEALDKSADLSMALNQQITSPLAVQNITLNLVEPGVAAGVATATSQAFAVTQGRIQAEDNFFRQLEAYPEGDQVLRRAYLDCVARYGEQEGIGWNDASQYCMKDVSKRGKADGSGMNFAVNGVAEVNGVWGDSNGGKIAYLTQFVFGPQLITRDKMTDGLRAWTRELAIHFRDYIGDIEFHLDELTDVIDIAEGKRAPAFRELKVRRVAPTKVKRIKDKYGRWRDAKGILALLEERRKAVYDGIFKILYDRCQDRGGAKPRETCMSSDPKEAEACMRRNSFFWNTELLSDKDLRAVGTSQFNFDEGMIEDLYHLAEGLGDKVQTNNTCAFLDVTQDSSAYSYSKIENGEQVSAVQGILLRLSRKIAKVQVIEAVISIVEFLDQVTPGSFNGEYFKGQAQSMLYYSVGATSYDQLQYLQKSYHDVLMKTFQSIQHYLAQAGSAGGSTFVNSGNRSSSGGNSLAPGNPGGGG